MKREQSYANLLFMVILVMMLFKNTESVSNKMVPIMTLTGYLPGNFFHIGYMRSTDKIRVALTWRDLTAVNYVSVRFVSGVNAISQTSTVITNVPGNIIK